MSKLFYLLAPVSALAIVSAATGHDRDAGKSSGEALCEIRAESMPGGGVMLQGVVTAPTALSGEYEFRVEKSGRAGSSNSMQSGDFVAAPSKASVVGEVGLGLERGAAYTAELTLTWRGGQTRCVKTHPDRI